MKVLIATTEKQGKRKNDFNFCREGEFVKFGMECDGETIDGSCGCRRSMCGFDTFKATTTFKVTDADITQDEYSKLWVKSNKKAGWGDHTKYVDSVLKELLGIARQFKINQVLEKRGGTIQVRRKQE